MATMVHWLSNWIDCLEFLRTDHTMEQEQDSTFRLTTLMNWKKACFSLVSDADIHTDILLDVFLTFAMSVYIFCSSGNLYFVTETLHRWYSLPLPPSQRVQKNVAHQCDNSTWLSMPCQSYSITLSSS